MHGVSKDITIDLEGLGIEVKDPWGNLRKGAQVTADINRKDFGIVYNSVLESGNLLIGETADVNVDLEFIKK
jgi:polyisoprenoid-binding protein YceI